MWHYESFTASKNALETWGKEQMDTLLSKKLNPDEKFYAACSFHFFNIDPSQIIEFPFLINGKFYSVNLEETAKLSIKTTLSFLTSGLSKSGHIETHLSPTQIPNTATFFPLRNSKLLSYKLENGSPVNDLGLIDCLHRKIISLGYVPEYTIKEKIAKNTLNIDVDALFIKSKKPPHS